MNEQQKLEITRKLLDFLKEEIPADQYDNSVLEVLMLAYHASTNTTDLRLLLRSI